MTLISNAIIISVGIAIFDMSGSMRMSVTESIKRVTDWMPIWKGFICIRRNYYRFGFGLFAVLGMTLLANGSIPEAIGIFLAVFGLGLQATALLVLFNRYASQIVIDQEREAG
jgi:hypothetical protein